VTLRSCTIRRSSLSRGDAGWPTLPHVDQLGMTLVLPDDGRFDAVAGALSTLAAR
jgi:hypothetical protein